MVFKRCKYDGCPHSPRCAHPWHVQVMIDGIRERGPLKNYAFLLPAGAPLPTTKSAADALEAYLIVWIQQGRPRVTPRPSHATLPEAPADAASAVGPQSFGDLVRLYQDGHVVKGNDKGGVSRCRALIKAFDTEPIGRIFDRGLAADFLDEFDDDCSANRNRHRSTWQHMLAWAYQHYGLDGISPFQDHYDPEARTLRKGIPRAKEQHRTRRLHENVEIAPAIFVNEEAALIAAAQALPDGGQMEGRLYCALDAGLRRGEMLAVNTRRGDLLRNYQRSGVTMIRVHWSTAKTRYERLVPVQSDRLIEFLARRAFVEFPFGQADGTRLESFRQDWETILLTSGLEAGAWSPAKTTRQGQTWRQWIRTVDADLHWHDLRHECGSRLAERGVPQMEIMRLLGHTDLETTQKYLNPELLTMAKSLRKAYTTGAASAPALGALVAELEARLGGDPAAVAALLAAMTAKRPTA